MSSTGDSKYQGKEVAQGLPENTLDDADADLASDDVRCKDLQMRGAIMRRFPNDLVSQIIGKLPIKSAIRFCAVSTNWLRVISSDIADSWSQASKNPRLLFTINRKFYSVSQTSPPQLWNLEKSKLPGFKYSSTYLCKPVRGSTICYERRGEAAICNPAWGVFRRLPDLTGLKRGNTTIFHLGYDDKLGIFKVLCVSSLPPKPLEFRVLSVVGEDWTWRRIVGNKKWVSVDYRRNLEAGYNGIFMEGKIYFEAGVSIICFDVIEENFRIITVPVGVQKRSNSLMRVNNKLGFVDSLSIWILEKETWCRQYSIPSELPNSQCLGTIAKDVFVFVRNVAVATALTLYHYDASKQLLENIHIADPEPHYWLSNIDAFIDYTESPYPDYYGRVPQAVQERRVEEKGNISVGLPLVQSQMARYSAATVDYPGSPKSVQIVVVGEKGTGKSSLITAAAYSYLPTVPPVLPDTKLHLEIPVTIVDTSSRPEDREMVAEELRNADAVVLTYDCGRPDTLEGLSKYWLPELRRLEVKVPIIVAGCKLDLRDDNNPVSLEKVMSPIMHQFPEIETFIECSAALKPLTAQEVFCYAQKRVLHPTGPLFDQESQTLKPHCKILTAAQHPHLSIPETEAGKSRKRFNSLIHHSLVVSIGAAAAAAAVVFGLVAAKRK